MGEMNKKLMCSVGRISQTSPISRYERINVQSTQQRIDLLIQNNLREGLSLTKYIIYYYGAHKEVVDNYSSNIGC